MKRDAALEFPMEHEDSHEDYIMWLRVLRKYGTACAVNEPLLRYRLSSSGKSGSKLQSAKMTFRVYRYMGFSLGKSLLLFGSYAVNGVAKYARSYLGDKG
jgi:teichuronic acid biosynthesis glycosyltransferase TuaG